MSTIYVETNRLIIRALEKKELPRLVELLDVWDVARWLAVLPYPYTMANAEEFYSEIEEAAARGEPQFFAIAPKAGNYLIGGVGLHPPRDKNASPGDVEIGYWLGQGFWGQGFMTEAVRPIAAIGMSRLATLALVATTGINNSASQNVLLKLGMKNLGQGPREYAVLRGENQIVKWRMTRKDWEAKSAF